MKTLALLLISSTAFLAPAQPKGQDPALKEYQYRYEITKPRYGLQKVQALIRREKPDFMQSQRDHAFDELTVQERFTYVALHGEMFSQGCFALPFTSPVGHKIFARPAEALDDPLQSQWSERETRFLLRHRGEVIDLLRQTIGEKKRIGANLKMVIEEIAARELIPDMLELFDRDRKDLDILTLCIVLMKGDRYAPFLASTANRTLYGRRSNEMSSLEANRANIDAIETMARNYWRESAR